MKIMYIEGGDFGVVYASVTWNMTGRPVIEFTISAPEGMPMEVAEHFCTTHSPDYDCTGHQLVEVN